MISKLDTYTFNSSKIVIDISEWQTVSVQVIGGGGTISILGTNDDGAITGSTNGSAKDAANFAVVQAVDLANGNALPAITNSDIYRIDPVSFKYLQIGDGATATATKIMIFKTKPY